MKYKQYKHYQQYRKHMNSMNNLNRLNTETNRIIKVYLRLLHVTMPDQRISELAGVLKSLDPGVLVHSCSGAKHPHPQAAASAIF